MAGATYLVAACALFYWAGGCFTSENGNDLTSYEKTLLLRSLYWLKVLKARGNAFVALFSLDGQWDISPANLPVNTRGTQ
jgi:hypothetical protein